ncbi:amino acid ABC transporter permease [Sinorhizobium meliloti]|uniref:ABC transporter permease subunit n=1 Tax=Rhizobium meliloti TaxID=382 RepID=A0AAW9TJZ2_RHIML|nr:amino acid ABC transporter permease [Sinorhizobium meliloti]MQW32244.1 ABC transporter permease subunit [Sinorhizobium meliloti]
MQGLDFAVLIEYLPLLAKGALWTALISMLAGLLSFGMGIIFAVALLYAPVGVRAPVAGFMWLFMGTPLLLQLFLIYFGLVQIGIDIPAIWSGVVGLGLHYSVYNADILRAGITSIDKGQTEGARSLGFGQLGTLGYVVVPQAVRLTLPPIGSNMIALLKESSLVSVIGVAELVNAAQLGISSTFRPSEFYIFVAVVYYLLNLILEGVLALIAKRVEATR